MRGMRVSAGIFGGGLWLKYRGDDAWVLEEDMEIGKIIWEEVLSWERMFHLEIAEELQWPQYQA